MKKANTVIGIILPTYNRKVLLNRAINSVLSQTYKSWVICVVDDGSSDDTSSMMQNYTDTTNIHYIVQPSNMGVNAARNTALDYLIQQRNCDFITLLDDDDYFDKNMLLEAKKVIDSHPQEKWFVSRKVTEDRKNITQVKHFGSIPYIDYYLGITMNGDATHVIHTSLIGNTHFSKQFKQAEEWIFFIDLSARSEMFTYNFASTICTYLEDGLSAQATHKKHKKSDQELAVEKLKEETLERLGYKPETIEAMKLKHRIDKTVQAKKYPKLLRYVPRYVYWKFKESLT